jgi:FixJ family two-component response regulator
MLAARDQSEAQTFIPSSPTQPTVYIVDDDLTMRKSLRWLIETLDVLVETFDCAETFLNAYDAAKSGCLVLDVMMPEMNGLDLQRQLMERGVDIPVIVLTGYADVTTAVRALKNGAIEFLEKPFEDEILLKQIRRALTLDNRRRHVQTTTAAVREQLASLTPRESQILQLVVEGLSSKQIATDLIVSHKTVEAHRAKIMQKMEAESVAQLVRVVVSTQKLVNARDDAS